MKKVEEKLEVYIKISDALLYELWKNLRHSEVLGEIRSYIYGLNRDLKNPAETPPHISTMLSIAMDLTGELAGLESRYSEMFYKSVDEKSRNIEYFSVRREIEKKVLDIRGSLALALKVKS